MNYSEYSYRHGKEILSLTHPQELIEIESILHSLKPFDHGRVKNKTPKQVIAEAFRSKKWATEIEIPLGTGKSDYCDIGKNSIFIEQEFSRFEMFFRDFFRFLLLYDERQLDVGIIITYDDSAFQRWGKGVKHYSSARASLGKLVDFLEGKYSAVVKVPIWCIGIE